MNPPREPSPPRSGGSGEPASPAAPTPAIGGEGGRPAGPRRWRPWRAAVRDLALGDLRAGLVFLLALTATGPLLGLLWAAISPRLDVAAGISGSETAFSAQADLDAAFGFSCLGAGLITGAIARWRAADAGWPVPAGIAAGGLAGSLLAGWIGHLVRSPGALRQLPPHAPAYVAGLVDVKVRATGLYIVLPATALVVLAVALWLPAALTRRGHAPDEPATAPDEAFAAASAFRPATLPPSEVADAPEARPNGLAGSAGTAPARTAPAAPPAQGPPASGELE